MATTTARVRTALSRCACMLFTLCLCAAGVAGCDDGPNTQRLPIGTRCSSDDNCGTTPYVCTVASHPGGYCARSCTTDGDCPIDAICAALSCRRKCTDDTTCRQSEGYVCRLTGATSPYCDIPAGGN